jgi:hypothetical protein
MSHPPTAPHKNKTTENIKKKIKKKTGGSDVQFLIRSTKCQTWKTWCNTFATKPFRFSPEEFGQQVGFIVMLVDI